MMQPASGPDVDAGATLVVQAYEAGATPGWIDRCMRSVREWAASRGYDYAFTDRFFGLAPDWFRIRCGPQLGPLTDVARLVLMQSGFARGYRRVVWCDADLVVFDPDALALPDADGLTAIDEVSVGTGPDGSLMVSPRMVNGALLAATRDAEVFLRYFDEVLRVVREHPPGPVPRTVAGPMLLTRIARRLPVATLPNVGLFTPGILLELAQGGTVLPGAYMRHFGHAVAAANLCHFARQENGAHGEAAYDAVMDRAIGLLLATRGEVVNRLLRAG